MGGVKKKLPKRSISLPQPCGPRLSSKTRGAAPLLWNRHCSVSTCAPQWLVWSFLCCCVVPVSCFVTVLFDSCVAVQSCRGKSYMSIFLLFLPYLQEHSCVENQKFCYHGNVTQRLTLSIAVQFNE